MKRTAEQNLVRTALSSKGFLQLNKKLARALSLHAAILLAELVWQEEKAVENNRVLPSGFFPVCRDALATETLLSAKQQRAAEELLRAHRFIERKVQTAGDVSTYKLDHSRIIKFLEGSV